MKFFWGQGIFFMNFDFKNEYKNEFKDNKENSWNRVYHKIDFEAQWSRYSQADSMEIKIERFSRKTGRKAICIFSIKNERLFHVRLCSNKQISFPFLDSYQSKITQLLRNSKSCFSGRVCLLEYDFDRFEGFWLIGRLKVLLVLDHQTDNEPIGQRRTR